MISIVIPVYNEAENIPELYSRLTHAAAQWDEEYEVVLVDDGSSDTSLPQLEMLHRRDPRWKVLAFSRNFGHQAAVSAGIFYCHGDAVAIMDADLQDPPEELRRFLEKWREGYQVVYAIRMKRKEGLLKRAAYKLFYQVLHRLASIDIPVDAGDFCLMDRAVVEVLKAMPERTRFVRGLRIWAGFRQVGVAYERAGRHAGTPKYTFAQLVRLAVIGMLLFSSVPLQLAAWSGFFLCAVSLLSIPVMLGWALVDIRFFGMRPSDVAGWTSLVALMLLMSGLQLLALGVIGQYLARIFDEVQGRPPWVIASALGFPERNASHDLGWLRRRAPCRSAAAHHPPGPRQGGNTMQAAYSSIYADLWRRHWWWRVRHELVLRTVAQLCPANEPSAQPRHIFDIGCAGGVSFDDLSRYGVVEGLEPDPTLVDACPQWRARIELTGFGPEYVPSRQYDLVLMLDVLEHLEDDAVALHSLWRLLKPGAHAIITVPALQSLWSVHDVLNRHYRRYEKTGLRRLLEDSGFAVRDLRYFFLWPLGLMYLRTLLLGTQQRPGKSYTVTVPPTPVNRLFIGLSRLEQRLMRLGLRWPLGSSLLAVVEKPRDWK